MPSSTVYSLAFLIGLSSLFSGCCRVPMANCDSCGVANSNGRACPSILHGELAGRVRNAVTGGCSTGCGEFYCDEHVNEPPTCDPCSGNGEFTASSCGPCRPLFQRLRELWGKTYDGSCGGCNTCSSGTCSSDAYATQNSGSGSGSGYCSNCRDGVAGNPSGHTPQHAHRAPIQSQPTRAQPPSESINPPPTNTSSPSLEPIPDPSSNRPVKSTSVKFAPSTSRSQDYSTAASSRKGLFSE